MKKVLLTLTLQLAVIVAFAQFSLKGRVTGQGDEPLTGASVVIKNTYNGISTATDGSFSFKLKAGQYTVVVSFIGYEKKEVHVELNSDKEITIQMKPSSILTEEVLISATRAKDKTPVAFTNVTHSEIESHGTWFVDVPDLAGSTENIQVQRGVGTSTNGIAALVYGASEVTAIVANGEEITITETTDYPFKESIQFTIQTKGNVSFPFHLRIPQWCKNPMVSVNGKVIEAVIKNNIAVIDREWAAGDVVELNLPMAFRYSYWYENSLGIERGPLVYALKIEEEWREISKEGYDDTFWEVLPKNPWNYAILKSEIENGNFKIETKDNIAANPWNLENAPVSVTTKAKRLPIWQMERGSAGKIPSPSWPGRTVENHEEEIVLIPYGCTTLRISQFPVK